MSAIKRFSQLFSSIYFSHVDNNTVLKEIKKLNLIKAVQDSDIPVNILKENADFLAGYIYLQSSGAVDSSKFADFFTNKDIAAAFKQSSRNQKKNYRPISILSLISKISEKIICKHSQFTLIMFYQNFSVVLERLQPTTSSPFNDG